MALAHQSLLAAGVLSAVGASLCCAAPLMLLMIGVGGAWTGYLAAIQPYQPFVAVGSLLCFSLAFQRLYLTRKTCASGVPCRDRHVARRQRRIFWVTFLPALALLASPLVIFFFL